MGQLDAPVYQSPLLAAFGNKTTKPYVILGCGQSNMLGSALSSEGDHTVDSGISIWNATPGGSHGTAWITPVYGTQPLPTSVNSLVWFANYLRRSGKIPSTRPIYLILNAVGGLPIENWTQSIAESPDMWADLTGQISASGIDHIDHVMWMQGEANRNGVTGGLANTQATYAAQFTLLYSKFQALSQWQPYTTFSMSEMGTWARNMENDRNDFVRTLYNYDNALIAPVSSYGLDETGLFVNSGAHLSGNAIQLIALRHFMAHSAMLATLGKGIAHGRNALGIADAGLQDGEFLAGGNITAWFEVSAVAIASGGSGGTNSTSATVTGTTGTGTKFQANVVISGGAITAINNISFNGKYSVVPSTTETVTGNSLSGAQLTLTLTGLVYRISHDDIRSGLYLTINAGADTTVIFPNAGKLTPVSREVVLNIKSSNNVLISSPAQLEVAASNIVLYTQTAATPIRIITPGIYRFRSVNSQWVQVGQFPNAGGINKNTIVESSGATVSHTTPQLSYGQVQVLNNIENLPSSGGLTGQGGSNATFINRDKTNTTIQTSNSGVLEQRRTLIITGGTGYAVNDTITIAGGTGTAAVITVTAVSGGVITAIGTGQTGAYSALPPSPLTQASTSGGGTGATFDPYFVNWIRGPHPKQVQKSYLMTVPGQIVVLEGDATEWHVVLDTSYGKLGRSTALISSSTLTDAQMKLSAIYGVNNAAALVLPLSNVVLSGETKFISNNGLFTIAPGAGDTIYCNNVAFTTAITIPINNICTVTCVEAGKWSLEISNPGAGEYCEYITATNYTVNAANGMKQSLIYFPGSAGTITLPTGSAAIDGMIIYLSNNAGSAVTLSQNVYQTNSTWVTTISATHTLRMVYINAQSKWYLFNPF